MGGSNYSFDLRRQSLSFPPSHSILTKANLPYLERRKIRIVSRCSLTELGPKPQTPKTPFFSTTNGMPIQANPIRVVDSPHHSCSNSRRRSLAHVPHPYWIQPGYSAKVRTALSINFFSLLFLTFWSLIFKIHRVHHFCYPTT